MILLFAIFATLFILFAIFAVPVMEVNNMPNETYRRIMEILDEQRMMEVESAMVAKKFMKRTLNPIRLIKFKHTYNMFIYHAIGISWAMERIQKEFES